MVTLVDMKEKFKHELQDWSEKHHLVCSSVELTKIMQRGHWTQVGTDKFLLKTEREQQCVAEWCHHCSVSYFDPLQASAYMTPLFRWQHKKQ